jgi:hypothetical protein
VSTINLNELNQYIKNFYGTVGLSELEKHHAAVLKEYFKENLATVGTYAHRDFAKYGNWKSVSEDDDHFGRADGWQSLSEEVPDVDHLTYGTGILYIHGEMEIPDNEKSKKHPQTKDHIFGDEFYHVDKTGSTKHMYEDAIDPERYISWGSPSNGLTNSYSSDLRSENSMPSNRGDGGERYGFVWEWKEETHKGTEGDGRWLYQTITDVAGGVFLEEKLGQSSANGETPTIFYDEENDVYEFDNDRHHFPWRVVNSTAPKSVKKFLEDYWKGANGMYDSDLPEIAVELGTYPPVKQGGIKYVKDGVDGILDYISPIDEAPE